MKEYDAIVIGTGSAMHFVDALSNKNLKTAVIDKDEIGGDEIGGICLTRYAYLPNY